MIKGSTLKRSAVAAGYGWSFSLGCFTRIKTVGRAMNGLTELV